ncbi:MAG TPA: TetR/AcrR family transcriptional regulator [Acidimicrobiales bacterium]|nr:TetR/AcrR family transcriptional regulator [Acidimicrobiales bacterium]
MTTDKSAPRTARARAREELTREIKEAARAQLAAVGAPSLSLREVARQLGMASSALYRYFPSRDDLLTALIIDAYDALGEAGEAADAGCERDDLAGRWLSACKAIRAFALARPNEYALIYGSPVPGYKAPEATIGPASRLMIVLAAILADASAGAEEPPLTVDWAERHPVLHGDFEVIRSLGLFGAGDETILRGITAWTQVFGMVSFELFGQFNNVIEDRDGLFERATIAMGEFIGLSADR